jgi:hypothetical protein
MKLTYFCREFDPWRTSGVSSQFRPEGPLESTPSAPVNIIPGGFHCSDLILKNGAVNAGVQAVIDTEIAQIVEWVDEFYEQKSAKTGVAKRGLAKRDTESKRRVEGQRDTRERMIRGKQTETRWI